MFTCPNCNYTTRFASSHIVHARLCGTGEPIEAIDYAPRPARTHVANTQVTFSRHSSVSSLPRQSRDTLFLHLMHNGVAIATARTAHNSRLAELDGLITSQQLTDVLTIANS